MIFFHLINSVGQFIIYALVLISAFTIHEFMHAYVADKMGDDTPRRTGRLTLNPLAHLDPLGTIFLFLAGFGWGKPVIINPRNFSNPKMDQLTVSLAGPMSNFTLAVMAGLVLRFASVPAVVQEILVMIVFFNLVLMIFNLLPIPPLDGSKALALVMSEENYFKFQQYGIFILFGLILFSSVIPVIPFILTKAVNFFFILITGASAIF